MGGRKIQQYEWRGDRLKGGGPGKLVSGKKKKRKTIGFLDIKAQKNRKGNRNLSILYSRASNGRRGTPALYAKEGVANTRH